MSTVVYFTPPPALSTLHDQQNSFPQKYFMRTPVQQSIFRVHGGGINYLLTDGNYFLRSLKYFELLSPYKIYGGKKGYNFRTNIGWKRWLHLGGSSLYLIAFIALKLMKIESDESVKCWKTSFCEVIFQKNKMMNLFNRSKFHQNRFSSISELYMRSSNLVKRHLFFPNFSFLIIKKKRTLANVLHAKTGASQNSVSKNLVWSKEG